tara:strand:- start:58715 stop:61105 length:2391 start_codon:yes stop_codon:yes gene_type:complete
MKNRILFYIFVFYCTIVIAYTPNNIEPNQLRFREMVATRTNTPPTIDGIIDDEVWESATIENGFLQFEPYNLAEPSERTEVRLIYDNSYIYIAVNNYDSKPEKIKGRLSRKDRWMEAFETHSDWLGVAFDSNNDDRTGYWFAVNPLGSRMDVFISGESIEEFNSSWDVVWNFEVVIHDSGWSVEMQIPTSVFQFDANTNHDWGISFARHIHRLQEEVQWPGRSKGVSGFVPHFGILKGMGNIPSPKKTELLPYVLIGNNDESNVSSLGLDMKYGLSAQSSLNMTVNPDFGQVEADPSVLNLTAFETQYDERRPFFIEGGSFFKNRYKLFHSRRIGQFPRFLLPDDATIIERPDATTILGAGKILGQTAGGTKYGIINAVTDEEYGSWEYESGDSTIRQRGMLEPMTNYFIGRIEQPIINNVSTIGIMMTDINRKKYGTSNVIGLDWFMKYFDNRVTFKGQLVQSKKDDIIGNGARFNIGYLDPKWWELNLVTGFTDEKYDINDIGFNTRNDTWYYGTFGELRKQDPWGLFLNNYLEFRYFINGRNDGLTLSKSLSVEQTNQLKSYWDFGGELNMEFASFNDDDTFRDDRAWVYKSETEGYGILWFQTDKRKKLILKPYLGYGRGQYRPWGYRAGLRIRYRPLNNINLMIEGFQDLSTKSMEWVGAEGDSNNTDIIYAESAAIMNDVQIRINWTFTPDLTVEAFFQPFTVDMDYKSFYKLMAEKTRDLEPYSYNGNPDFKINNLVGTFVLRWEYHPGSTLFVVYNLHNNNYFSASENSWDRNSSNSVFIKFNYWLQI